MNRDRGRGPLKIRQRVLLPIVVRDLVDVTQRNQSRVGIGSVQDYLHRRGLPLAYELGEPRQDLDGERYFAVIDQVRDLMPVGQRRGELKVAVGFKTAQ